MTEIKSTPKSSFLKTIFFSPDKPRLRAGWRLILQTILLMLIAFVVGLPFSLITFIPNMSDSLYLVFSQVIEIIAVTLSIFLATRFLDKRPFASLGLKVNKWLLLDILAGIVITFFMMGFIYLVEWSQGWLTFNEFAWQVDNPAAVLSGTFGMLIVFIFVGWNEELISRGYHLQTLTSGLNLFWGVFISSAVFGLLHLGNPNATWISALGILFAGLFLAFGYITTKQLWLPIGLHIGWNFFEGVVFGFPVSGLDIYRLTRITVSGPELWTGGAFGPEAGLVILPGLILGVALVYAYAKHIRRTESNSEFEF